MMKATQVANRASHREVSVLGKLRLSERLTNPLWA